ncbi:MAG: PHP domain-containing protein [Elusimicrobia bacterium]|nr:PHP domain-containing protein [Elusimicrobiota bacterium]
MNATQPLIDYGGAIHIHSDYSYDCQTPLAEIVAAAQEAGLDFAILTDHFRLDARHDGWERWHGQTLLIVGEEISPRYNHYVALGLREPIVVWKGERNPQGYIDAVARQGGFGFIAHPDHPGALLAQVRRYPWLAWEATGYTGMGIWDLVSDWIGQLRSPLRSGLAYLTPATMLTGPRPETLIRWDQLNQRSHCIGIGEVDNHNTQRRVLGIPVRIFPYRFAFRTIRTHILLEHPFSGETAPDIAKVLGALRQGRCYVAQEFWWPAAGFSFRIFDDHQEATMGETFTIRGPALLEVKAPQRGRIRLIHDGQLRRLEERTGMEVDVKSPGVYRIEVWQKPSLWQGWKPWLYSNPIWVTPGVE